MVRVTGVEKELQGTFCHPTGHNRAPAWNGRTCTVALIFHFSSDFRKEGEGNPPLKASLEETYCFFLLQSSIQLNKRVA